MGLLKQVKRHSGKGCKQSLDTYDRIERTQIERAKRFQKKRSQVQGGDV